MNKLQLPRDCAHKKDLLELQRKLFVCSCSHRMLLCTFNLVFLKGCILMKAKKSLLHRESLLRKLLVTERRQQLKMARKYMCENCHRSDVWVDDNGNNYANGEEYLQIQFTKVNGALVHCQRKWSHLKKLIFMKGKMFAYAKSATLQLQHQKFHLQFTANHFIVGHLLCGTSSKQMKSDKTMA